MLPDRVSNPGPLTYESGALPIAKNHMNTGVITLWCIDVMSLTRSMSTMCFLLEILPILKAIKSHFKG